MFPPESPPSPNRSRAIKAFVSYFVCAIGVLACQTMKFPYYWVPSDVCCVGAILSMAELMRINHVENKR